MEIFKTNEGIDYNSFIYIWKDNIKNMYYIGSHIGNENDRYKFGGIDIKKEYKKRPEDFQRSILSYHITSDNFEIRNIEKEYLIEYDVENRSDFYNRTNESYGGTHIKSIEKRLLDIDENGLNHFQRAAKKMVETRKKKDSYKTAKVKEYVTKSANVEQYDKTKNKISETLKGSRWVNKNGNIKYIKQNDYEKYKIDGWKDGLLSTTYQECRDFAKQMNIKNKLEWYRASKESGYPHSPDTIFSEWVNWEEFLGKKKKIITISYKECSDFAKKMNIKSQKQWKKISNLYDIPYNPDRKYKSEWINWDIFLQK